jgi:hypothetical protein
MKTLNLTDKKIVDVNAELDFCISHVQKIWDLSTLEFKDKNLTNDVQSAFITTCFNYGRDLARSAFYDNQVFHSAMMICSERENYLSDILDIDFMLVSHDPIVSLLSNIYKKRNQFEKIIDKKTNGFLKNFTKATNHFIENLNDMFDGIDSIKPYGYKSYISKHDDKELIYGYEDKLKIEVDSFDGHYIDCSMHDFASRIAISNTGYQDVEQGYTPHFTLVGALFIQGRSIVEFNNHVKAMNVINSLDIGALPFSDNIDLVSVIENLPSYRFFMYKNESYDLNDDQITTLGKFKNKDVEYSYQEYIDSKDLNNIDITSRKIRLMLKKKNKPLGKESISMLLGMIDDLGMNE